MLLEIVCQSPSSIRRLFVRPPENLSIGGLVYDGRCLRTQLWSNMVPDSRYRLVNLTLGSMLAARGRNTVGDNWWI